MDIPPSSVCATNKMYGMVDNTNEASSCAALNNPRDFSSSPPEEMLALLDDVAAREDASTNISNKFSNDPPSLPLPIKSEIIPMVDKCAR